MRFRTVAIIFWLPAFLPPSSNPSPKNLLFTDGRAAVYAEKQEKSQPFDIYNYKRG
jgi:hypothetical protein